MLTWAECRDAFEPDGSLRDIYILDAGIDTWEATLRFIVSCGDTRFELDGAHAGVPATARDALVLRPSASPHLSIRCDGLDLACQFFTIDEVELDFWPAAIDGPERFGSLLSFVRGLAIATGREVIVTPENSKELPFLRYAPASDQFAFLGGAG